MPLAVLRVRMMAAVYAGDRAMFFLLTLSLQVPSSSWVPSVA
jgi:hypothetical protein